MFELTKIEEKFERHGGVLRTSDLTDMGLSTRQIERLRADGVLTRVKHGDYTRADFFTPEDVIVERLSPRAVLFLERALSYYEYIDRIPSAWQIAVDKDSAKSKYNIRYPRVAPFYIEPRFLDIGVDTYDVDGVSVKIYNRERTICDVLRYER